jgi:hypothetical protein
MNKCLFLLLTLVAAGCGGDRERPPAEVVGKLHGGGIQGVEWRTPTRSGVTDSDGRFAYLPGETVTFSLGDIELGAAPGSSDITLFTLAGLTPPTTERALRRQLDRAMRMSTPFTRAINLDLLLIALDADANPDNGLDVRNRRTALSGVALDLDQRIGEFGNQLFTRVPSLTQSIPGFKPIAHLYSSLGLRVPVHAPTRVVTEGVGGLSTGVRTLAYRPDGSLDSDDDDPDGDGLADSHVGYEYDAFGRVTQVEYWLDFNLDHAVDQRYSSTSEFDARGKIIAAEQISEAPAFGDHQTWRLVENVVDDFGRTTRQVAELDEGSDGSVDSRQVVTAEYDTAHGRTVYVTTTDVGVDGVVDSLVRTTQLEDARRRVSSRIAEYDDDANGVFDSRFSEIYVYDDVVRTARNTSESDVDADGTPDWRAVTTWQLDRAGNAVAQSATIEPFADGVISQAQSVAREFDDARRVTKSTRDEDYSGDGVADSRQIDATTYDELGNATWISSDYDYGVDGETEAHVDEASEYGAGGELLASAVHYDLNGDGLTDIRSAITVENTVVDDGVRLLTDWYFRARYSGVQ